MQVGATIGMEEGRISKFFKIRERGSTIRTEVFAGLIDFLANAYLLVLIPQMLSRGSEGGAIPDGTIETLPLPREVGRVRLWVARVALDHLAVKDAAARRCLSPAFRSPVRLPRSSRGWCRTCPSPSAAASAVQRSTRIASPGSSIRYNATHMLPVRPTEAIGHGLAWRPILHCRTRHVAHPIRFNCIRSISQRGSAFHSLRRSA